MADKAEKGDAKLPKKDVGFLGRIFGADAQIDFKAFLQQVEELIVKEDVKSADVLELFRLYDAEKKGNQFTDHVKDLHDFISKVQPNQYNNIAVIWLYAKTLQYAKMISRETYELEHKVWQILFRPLLPVLPAILLQNPTWKDPLKKIITNVVGTRINHFNYIPRDDLSGESKLFLVTVLMLDDPLANATLWKNFWNKYGYALFEYNKIEPLMWRIVWKTLPGYELFQAPFDKVPLESLSLYAADVIGSFEIAWPSTDALEITAKLLNEICLAETNFDPEKIKFRDLARQNLSAWFNGLLLLADFIHGQLADPQDIPKVDICKTLMQHTISEAIKEKLSINTDDIAVEHNALVQHVVKQCINDLLPKLAIYDTQNSPILRSFLTAENIVFVLNRQRVSVGSIRELTDHVASKDSGSALAIFKALIDKINLSELAKFHFSYPNMTRQLPKNMIGMDLDKRVNNITNVYQAISLTLMEDMHRIEDRLSEQLPETHVWLTEKLADAIIEKGWSSDHSPLPSLCNFLGKFVDLSKNVPTKPCLLHTMLTKAALVKVTANLRTCWTALPRNFHVLFARDTSRRNDHYRSALLINPLINLNEELKIVGSPSVPLERLKRSELMNLCKFWSQLQNRHITDAITIHDMYEYYNEGLKQLEESDGKVRKVNLIIAWLNNKQFQPPIDEIQVSADPSQIELNELAALPQIDEHSFKHLNFFIPEESALFKAIFDDKRKEDADLKELTSDALSKIIERTSLFLKNLSSLANLEKIAEYHARFRSRFSKEINLVAKFFAETTDLDVKNLEKYLLDAFQLLEYIENVHFLMVCLQDLNIYPEVWDSLQQIYDERLSVRSMKASLVQEKIDEINKTIPSLTPEHLAFFQTISHSRDVINFLGEFTDEAFNAQVQFLNDHLQGFQHGLDLVTSAVAVRHSLAPVLASLQASRRKAPTMTFHEFCHQMANVLGTTVKNHTERLRYVMDKLSEVRVNFKQDANLTIEEMLPYVGKLINNGYYTSRTTRHRGGSDISFKFKESNEAVDRVFPLAALQDLIVAINVFVDQDNIDDSKRKLLEAFISLYNLARKIHEMHLALEETGHPDYQMIEVKLNDVGGLNVAHYHARLEDLTRQRDEWLQVKVNIKDRLLMLSNQQMAVLISLIRRIYNLNDVNIAATLYPYCWKCLPDISVAKDNRFSVDVVAASFNEVKAKFVKPAVSISDAINIFAMLLELVIEKSIDEDELIFVKKTYPGSELVMALGMDNTQIFYALADLNDEPPHPSQVLVCTRSTKKDELLRIVDCACSAPWLTFILVEVNNLRMEVRASLIDRLLTLEQQKQRHSLKLVFTSQTGISGFSFISKRDVTLETLGQVKHYLANESKRFKPDLARNRHFKTLEIVQGNPGEGKSTSIRQYFAQQSIFCLEIPLQEDFTVANFIAQVQKAAADARRSGHKDIGIHLNILPYINFPLVHEFLYSWMLFGVIYDGNIGGMYQLPTDLNWHVLAEVGSAPAEDKEYGSYSTPTKVLTALPALDFAAEKKDRLLKQLVLDDNIRLACAYYHHFHNSNQVATANIIAIVPVADNNVAYQIIAQIVQRELQTLGEHRNLFIFQRMFLHLLAARCKWIKAYAERLNALARELANPEYIIPVEEQFFFKQFMTYFITEVAHFCKANISLNIKTLPVISLREADSFCFVDCQGDGVRDRAKAGLLHLTGIQETIQNPKVIFSALALALGITDTRRMFNVIRQQRFTMTFDFVVKLLLLNDRRIVGQNVIFKGDTGLGKTETLDLFALVLNCNTDLVPDIISDTAQFITNNVLREANVLRILNWKKHLDVLGETVPSVNKITAVIREVCNEQVPVAQGAENQEPQTYFPFVAKNLLEFMRRMLAAYPLIELTPGLLRVSRMNTEDALNDVNELVQLLEEFLKAKIRQLFHKITMHAGMTAEQLRTKINELKELSAKISQTCPDVKLVVFIDEFNTTSIMGMVKNILFDHRLDGESLPSNIFFAAAMNPYTIKEVSGELDYTGVASGTKSLPFIVRPNPQAIDLLAVAFSDFDQTQEERFLTVFSKTRDDLGSPEEMEIVKDFLLAGQNQLRAANMERIHVSIRDIMRAIDLFVYFSKTPAGAALLGLPADSCVPGHHYYSQRFWHSLFMACNITYRIRLAARSDLRSDLMALYKALCLANDYTGESIDEVIERCYTHLYESTAIPDGIARTKTLMENLFVLVTCIDAKIPVMIIGPAGTSKTLSFTITADNMRNKASTKELYRLFSQVHPFRYQCTQHSTDTEVDGVYQSAIRRQKFFENDTAKNTERSTVFLDEANLPDDFEMPLKVLHYHLDHPVVSSVILCNRILDAPKTNRAVVLQLPPSLTQEDLYALAKGSFSAADESEYNRQLLMALCSAFSKINSVAKEFRDKFFQHRDFIYFLRFLRTNSSVGQSARIQMTPKLLINALERNFNGIPFNVFRKIVQLFIEEFNLFMMHKEAPWDVKKIIGSLNNRTIQLIEESLAETVKPDENPNLAPFRYMMLLDPTDSDAAVSLFLSTFKQEVEVCYVGEFDDDATDEARGNLIRKVTQSMATGKTVLLLNVLPIATSFYDLFNRHFSKKPSADQSYYAYIAVGSNSRPCVVHPNFKVIVHIPISSLAATHLPFLDRFEKYQLSVEQVLEAKLSNLSLQTFYCANNTKIDGFTMFKNALTDMVEKLHGAQCNDQLLYGINPKETVSSFIYAILQNTLSVFSETSNKIMPMIWEPFEVEEWAKEITEDGNEDPAVSEEFVNPQSQAEDDEEALVNPTEHIRASIRQLNLHLMQLARPEIVFNCRTLPKAYVTHYLLKQEHFSVLRFLKQLLKAKANVNVKNKWTVYSRSSAYYHQADVLRNAIEEIEPGIQLEEFDKVRSGHQCDTMVQSFFDDASKKALVILLDMTRSTTTMINYLRHQIDSYSAAHSDRLVVLIMHFPPELNFISKPIHQVIYLNDWDYMYIDSLGAKSEEISDDADPLEIDARTWIALGYGLKISKVTPSSIKNAFKKAFFIQVTKFMARWNGRGSTPAYMAPTRNKILKDFLDANSHLYEEVLMQFSRSWSDSLLSVVVSDVSEAIQKGSVVDSFASVVLSSLQFLLAPFALGFLRRLYGNGNFDAVQNALKAGSEDCKQLILLSIKAIKVPKLKTVLQQNAISDELLTIDPTFVKRPSLPYYDFIYDMLTEAYRKVRSQSASNKSLRTRVLDYIQDNVALKELVQHLDKSEELKDKFMMCFVQRTLGFDKLRPTLQEVCKLVIQKLVNSPRVIDLLFVKLNHEDKFTVLNSCLMPLQALGSDDLDNILVDRLHEAFQLNAQNMSIAEVAPLIDIVVSSATVDILWDKLNTIEGDREQLSEWQKAFGLLFDRYPSHFHLPSADQTQAWKYSTMASALLLSQQFEDKCLPLFTKFEAVAAACGVVPSKQVTLQQALQQSHALIKHLNIPMSEEVTYFAQKILHAFLIHASTSCYGKAKYLIDEFVVLCNDADLPLWTSIPASWKANMFHSLIDVATPTVKEEIIQYAGEVLKRTLPAQHQFVINPLSKQLTNEEAALIKKQLVQETPLKLLESTLFFTLLQQSKANTSNLGAIAAEYLECTNASILDQIHRAVLAVRLLQTFGSDISAANSVMQLVQNYPVVPVPVIDTIKKVITQETTVLNRDAYLVQSIANDERLVELVRDQPLLERLGMSSWFMNDAVDVSGGHLLSFIIDETSPLHRKYQQMKQSVVAGAEEQFLQLLNDNTVFESRMLLVLVTYYEFFVHGRACDFIRAKMDTILTQRLNLVPREKSALLFLSLGPKATPVEFDPVFLFTAHAQQRPQIYDLKLAHLLVNMLAIAMGTPTDSNHLYIRMFAPEQMRGTCCPGSDSNRGNHDCGFKYDEKTCKLTSSSQPPIMGDHALKRMALNATTWGALCWSCIVDEAAANVVLDPGLHLLNYVDLDVGEFAQWARANIVLNPAQKARSYIFRRFATFFQLLSSNHEVAEQQIQPSVFLNEVLIELMKDAVNPAKPAALKSVYATVQEAVNYEEHMRGIFNRVLTNIKDRQEVYQVQLIKSNKIFALAQGLKRNLCGFGPVFSFDKFTTVLANTDANQYTELILEFIRNMNSPSLFTCLQYATQLITFYRNVNTLFNNRLTTEDTLKPISECIQILRTYEAEDIVKQFENSFAEFKKSWEEISYLLITLDPEACAGQAFELEVPQIEDDTPFIVLISDPSDPRCMDSIIKVLTTLFNRQEKLLSMCDAVLPDARPDPVQAEWLPLHADHQFMLLNSVDLDYVKHVCVSQLTLPNDATIHIPHNGLSFNTQRVALFLIRLLQSKPVIKLGNLKQRFSYKIGESADFSSIASLGPAQQVPAKKPVVELVRAQMGVNPIQFKANSIRDTSRFAVPLELTDRVRVKQLLSTLSDIQFTKLCDQLAAILTWIMIPSVNDQSNQLNGLLVEAKNTSLHSLAKEALQLANEDAIGPMSFTACYLKEIALLVVDFHNLRAKLFQYSPDVDEELSEAAQTKLNDFAKSISAQKKKWFDKSKQLLGELQQPRVANLLEANMHKPLRIFIKKEMAAHGWTDDEVSSALPLEVQARNFGAYLRHMYRLCGELSFSFSPSTKSTTAAVTEQGVYVELVPDGIITAEPEGSNYVEAPDYSKLEEEAETHETPNLITEFNAPNVKPHLEQQSVTEYTAVTGVAREVPKLIKNLGNTCYMSSVLQVLTALSEVSSICLNEAATPLAQLVQHVYANDADDSVYPTKFQTDFAAMKKAHKRFKIGDQQDAHEFLVHLIDSLPKGVNQLFKIDLSYAITCQHCQHVEQGTTELFDLPLDIKPSGPNQLHEMLNSFVKEPVDEWTCTKCQQKHEHNVKHYKIVKLPKVLVLVFKRFKTTMFSREKDNTFVSFPTKNFVLEDFSDDLTSLDLFGSVVHSGSLNAGHYYSYFMRNRQWYAADDLTQRIKEISVPRSNELNGSYIVFYATSLPAPVEHVQVQSEPVQESHAVRVTSNGVEAVPTQDLHEDLLAAAVELNALLTHVGQDATQHVVLEAPQRATVPIVAPEVTQPEVNHVPVVTSMTSSIVDVKQVPVQSTNNSVVEAKSPQNEINMTSSTTSSMNSSLTSSTSSDLKKIIVRKLGAKRGGSEVINPSSIQELLTVGGTKLKIQAVNVRRADETEAEIDDINAIEHKEVVYLTTAEEEKEF